MSRSLARRAAVALGVTGVAGLLLATPASAHVGTSEDEVPAGSTTDLGLTLGHGCDGSPTTAVAIQIPEGVVDASAFAKPGWTVTAEPETLPEPVEVGHGEELTERVAVITFTADAGQALAADLRDTFTIHFTAPDTEGERLYFKTIQTCEAGSNDWIAETPEGGEEPDNPAPFVTVAAAVAGSDHHAEEGGTDTTEAAHDEATHDEADVETTLGGETASADAAASDDGGDGNGLAVAGLVVGFLGLATGGAALARTRSSASPS